MLEALAYALLVYLCGVLVAVFLGVVLPLRTKHPHYPHYPDHDATVYPPGR